MVMPPGLGQQGQGPPGRADVANAVAGAGLVIENGAGYDAFLSQLLGATSHHHPDGQA
jgi:hypothetical protein